MMPTKLDNMFHLINKENRGALFINQEVQSIDLLNRIVELKDLQTQGIYKAPQVKMDNKDLVSEHRYYMISIYQN
jgi:3,4-dihydroxy 2-butanone 4-phosphate synthase/GTP cyclohydrolase II